MERKIIEASEGMILTNGEVFGKKIYLAKNSDAEAFREITEEEYNIILKEGEDAG